MTGGADLLRTYLRQRRELGETEVVLEGIGAVELLRLVERGVAPARIETFSPPPDHGKRRQSSTEPPAIPPSSGAGTPAVGLTPVQIVQLGDLAEVRATALECPRCRLAGTRKQVVFGEGDERAELMVVGEAPGADEDRTGRPFVGKAGKLLDLLLASVGFPREAVYICNVLKCRPPGNRDPRPDEIEACSPYLRRQVELIAPRAILTLGTFPSQTLLASAEPIGRLRGREHRCQGVPLVPTYHPAALLRNPGWIRLVWDDLQRVRALLDEDPGRA